MAKGDFKDNLWLRGHQWYLRLRVPRQYQSFFLSSNGKPMSRIVERLGDSREEAKIVATEKQARLLRVCRRIKTGDVTTPEQAMAEFRGSGEYDIALQPGFEEAMRRYLAGPPGPRELEQWRQRDEQITKRFERYGADPLAYMSGEPAVPSGETVTQAAEAWFAELTRDEAAAPRDATISGYRQHVQRFVDKVGDLLLTGVTRVRAWDFLISLDISNGTRNSYTTTLRSVFECARRRGRFTGDNPFDDMKAKVARKSYEAFTIPELQKLFDALPREVRPKKHTADTALPWVALIALYSGMRLEEIVQLTVADVRKQPANGADVWCISIHNGGENKLKNETSARLVPVHPELARLGLLDYVKALPKTGPLFPGLVRRASNGKIGKHVGNLFRKKLVALGLKRKQLVFHSFRHCVAGALDRAAVPQSDAARVLGHAVAGMSYGGYSKAGPGLIRVRAVVEKITYDGLRL